MLKKLLRTISLAVSGILYALAYLIEVLAFFLLGIAAGLTIKDIWSIIIQRTDIIWKGGYLATFKGIWDED